jgi:predicted secreted hydrolase
VGLKKWMVLAAAGCLAASGLSAADWLQVTEPPELILPSDHGAHPGFRTEWWYATGLVTADDGHRYGFQITFFRQGLARGPDEAGSSALRARQIVAAHIAVADISKQRFHHAERLRRADGSLAGFSTADLEVWLDDWRLVRGEDGTLSARVRDAATGIGLELELWPQRELVLHGDRGYSRKGTQEGNASVYVSWTRLTVKGELEVGGSRLAVSGAAWFDHEWGTSQLGEGVVGWDWFSLRLDDGSDLMVYRLRRGDGTVDPFSSGSLVTTGGEVVKLGAEDFMIEPTGFWSSQDSGATYPSGWRLRVPRYEIDLELRPLLSNAEIDGSRTTGVVYWEGPVVATGSTTGEGYVELTGYAGSLEGRF